MAAARCRFGMTIFETPDDERRAVSAMPLERLAIDPALRDAVERFGIVTVGQFARLPAAGLRQRFGEAAEQLHRLVTDGGQAAAAWVAEEELRETRDLEYRESNAEALAFWIKQTLDPLLARVEAVHARVTHVGVSLRLDDGVCCPVSIKPAEPTNDVTILLDLIRLRLEGLPLTAGVVSFATQVWIARVEGAQLSLFAAEGRRDLEAANRALARVRAELGDGSVQRLTVRDAHLPEARSQLVPFERLVEARPSSVARPRLVRRLHERPTPLHGRARHEPDGWMVAGLEAGPVDASWGPFSVSGGWWAREVQRDYYIAETRRGDLLWLFHDRVRRAWFLHGAID
jgi:protein ImuB